MMELMALRLSVLTDIPWGLDLCSMYPFTMVWVWYKPLQGFIVTVRFCPPTLPCQGVAGAGGTSGRWSLVEGLRVTEGRS